MENELEKKKHRIDHLEKKLTALLILTKKKFASKPKTVEIGTQTTAQMANLESSMILNAPKSPIRSPARSPKRSQQRKKSKIEEFKEKNKLWLPQLTSNQSLNGTGSYEKYPSSKKDTEKLDKDEISSVETYKSDNESSKANKLFEENKEKLKMLVQIKGKNGSYQSRGSSRRGSIVRRRSVMNMMPGDPMGLMPQMRRQSLCKQPP